MKTGRLIRIGLLFAGTLIILFWGLNFLKGKNFLQAEKTYYVKYEKIGGLMISSPITLKGFKVGEVREIKLSDKNFDEILVQFVISYPELEIPKGSVPGIYSIDLMGSKGIQLLLSDSIATYAYGDTLIGSIEGDLKDQVNTQMLPLKRKAEDLMSSMDSVLIALHLVFDQENRSNLSQSFEVVAKTLQNFEQTSVFLDTFVKAESNKFSLIMNNLDSLSIGLVSRTDELQSTLINLSHLTDSLNQIPIRDAVEQFSLVLNDISILIDHVNSGQGSFGKFVMDDSLYNSIETVSFSLNELLEDIRKNPKRYVRLSAIDKGKTIIASDENSLLTALSKYIDIDFHVCLLQTQIPLESEDNLFKEFRKLRSIQVGKQFYYYILKTDNYDRARRIVAKHIHDYPDAAIYSHIEGKWQRVHF